MTQTPTPPSIDWNELFSGLIGSVIGIIAGAGLVYWQSREVARHDLRSKMFVFWHHLIECRSSNGHAGPVDPWSVSSIKDPLVAAFYRYRALCGPFKRRRLDVAWKKFCGADKDDYPTRACTFKPADEPSKERAKQFLDVI